MRKFQEQPDALKEGLAAEEALRQSEEQFRAFFELAGIGAGQADVETGRLVRVNERLCKITGYSREELLSNTIRGLTHPDDRDADWEKFQRMIRGGTGEYDAEKRYIRKDGKVIWVHVTATVVRDAQGRSLRTIGVVQDITERKQAEERIQSLNEELQRRVEEFRTLIDTAPVGIGVAIDLECNNIWGNAEFARMLGADLSQNLSKSGSGGDELPFRILRNGREVPAQDLPMQRACREGAEVLDEDLEIVRSDGKIIHELGRAIPLRDEQGRVRGCIGVFLNVTERKHAEQIILEQKQELERREARMRAIVETAVDAIVTISGRGTIESVNPAFMRIFGYPPEEVVGRNVSMLMPSPYREEHDQYLANYLKTGVKKIIGIGREVLGQHKDGTVFPMDMAVSEMRLGDRRMFTGILRDITGRKQAEEALRELNRTLTQQVDERTAQLRELAAQLSQAEFRESRRVAQLLHDELQQTLVSQRLILDHLCERAPGGCRQDLGIVLDTTNEALQFCRTLTADLAVPALNEPGLRPLLEWLKTRARELHGLQLRLIARGADPECPFPAKVELYYVVRELLLNVAKHAGVSRATVILDRSKPGECVLTVSDRGKGFHSGQAVPRHGRGSGIGLTSVGERVARLGGRLKIESHPEAGTRVTARFPVLGTHPAVIPSLEPGGTGLPPLQPAVLAANPPQTRVLLVDDHRLVRSTLRKLLEQGGEFQVVGEARDGAEAVELALQLQPDVILMDVSMPNVDGIEATRRLTIAAPHMAVVGLSMHEEKDIVDSMRAAGAREYVSKDTDLPRLCNTIRRARVSCPRGGGADHVPAE